MNRKSRRLGRAAVFLAPLCLVLAIAAFSGASLAQSLPGGMSQLQELQQQMQNRQSGGGLGQDDQQQAVTLRPAVPMANVQQPPSRLEMIMSARAHARLTQFGYDQLGDGRSVTISQAGAVQDDYILGPGDELLVSLRGQENNEFRVPVDRNGQIVLPRIPPVPAMGRSLGSLRQSVNDAVARAYVATTAFVSVSRIRQITVQVAGEVNNAGPRLVTGLSSVVDALLLSGGVKKTGSLRNIVVRRGGRSISVDLYGYLTGTVRAPDIRLTDGDQIVVPPLGETVAISGLVRRPGIYELSRGENAMSVPALLGLAGGQEVRGNYRMSLMQIMPDGRTQLVQVSGDRGQVHDSEILFVQMGADHTTGQATLAGGTGLAGSYAVSANARLSDLLKSPGALGPSPYTPFGIIVRKNPQTLLRQLVAFTPVAVLAGREDQVLQSDDVVRVLSVNEARMLNFIIGSYLTQLAEDQSQIRNPLLQATEKNDPDSLFKQLATQSRQNTELESIASVPAYIQRKDITALLDFPEPGSRLARVQAQRRQRLRFEMARNESQSNPVDMQDEIGAKRPNYAAKTNANTDAGIPIDTRLLGDDHDGRDSYDRGGQRPDRPSDQQPDQQFDLNYIQQNVQPGGFAQNREVETFGQLARQLDIDPLILVNFLIDHRVRLDGAVHGPGSYFAGPSATLEDVVSAAGGTLNWADESGVELISTVVDRRTGRAETGRRKLSLHTGELTSYLVNPRDQFRFSQASTLVGVGSVTVQGEVSYPGTFSILRGEHLSDLLKRAGGLTTTAYPQGTVYLRQSAAQAERQAYDRAADEVQDQLMIAMTRVGNGKLDPNTFSSMQSFVQELRKHQALGRVSFVADPSLLAANPARDPLLEAGDVIYIPPRPSTIAVLGQVLQPGNFTYRSGATIEDYLQQAGGYSTTADESHTYVVLPNGAARRISKSWLSFDVVDLPPGSSIVVPRDVTPLDLRQTIIDVSQVFSQFAVSIASIAVLSKQ
jgi:protein involved in polysaccharide export with SLBB domain